MSLAKKLTQGLLAGGLLLNLAATPTTEKPTLPSFQIPSPWEITSQEGDSTLLITKKSDDEQPIIHMLKIGKIDDLKTIRKSLQDDKSYREGRKEFVKNLDGKVLRFFPYEEEMLLDGSEMHTHGYRFSVGEMEFTETSHFVLCKDNLYYLHTLITDSQMDAFGDEMNEIVRSFQCS